MDKSISEIIQEDGTSEIPKVKGYIEKDLLRSVKVNPNLKNVLTLNSYLKSNIELIENLNRIIDQSFSLRKTSEGFNMSYATKAKLDRLTQILVDLVDIVSERILKFLKEEGEEI